MHLSNSWRRLKAARSFSQSCQCQRLTAGLPTCTCFGSLVRRNQNNPLLVRSRGKSTASKAGLASDWPSAGLATDRGTGQEACQLCQVGGESLSLGGRGL